MAARKKAAPKRGASRYQAPANKPVHPLVWVISGLIIGIFVMSLFKLDPGDDAIKREKSVAESKKPTASEKKEASANKPKFEFYTRPNGHNEFLEFYNTLPYKDRRKLMATIEVIEKEGMIDEAINVYEKSIIYRLPLKHPYERLAILYRKRKD